MRKNLHQLKSDFMQQTVCNVHLISRRVLLISTLNKYYLLFGGNLSLRYEGVILFIIL